MRLPLRDGQWVELLEHITHGQDKEIRKAYTRGIKDPELVQDWADVLVAAYVTDWHVLDLAGQAIPWSGEASLLTAPDDVIDDIFEAVTKLHKATDELDPPTPPSSPDSPSAVE